MRNDNHRPLRELRHTVRTQRSHGTARRQGTVVTAELVVSAAFIAAGISGYASYGAYRFRLAEKHQRETFARHIEFVTGTCRVLHDIEAKALDEGAEETAQHAQRFRTLVEMTAKKGWL